MTNREIQQLLSLAVGRRFEILQSMRFARMAQQSPAAPDYLKLAVEREANDAAIAALENLAKAAA